MHPTAYQEANAVIAELLAGMQSILGERLTGLYVFGSLATGAFEPGRSDIDLLAAVATDLTADEFAGLDRLHHDVVQSHPAWLERIEVGYLAVDRLRKMEPGSRMALISPGEPFHLKESGYDWLFNLNSLLERNLTVYGPPPDTLIDPVPVERLLRILPDQMREWRTWVTETDYVNHRGYHGYMVITMCRSLYLFRNRHQVSKREATDWAQAALPEWAPLIRDAIRWCEYPDSETADLATTKSRSLSFVAFVTGAILAD